MKQLIQNIASRCGYTISRKRPRPDIEYINVLELVVRQYMRNRPNACVVQIGANDGQRADPVHKYIVKYGWKGILVEPQPRAFEQLKQTYCGHSHVILENCAIARTDGEVKFYTVADAVAFRWTGLAQLNREKLVVALAGHGFERPESLIQTISVPALSLASLVARHSLTHIDLLQVDTEGFDYEIVKMIDFELMPPSIIHFEHACVPIDEQCECWEYLAANGYQLAMVQGDTVACRPSVFAE